MYTFENKGDFAAAITEGREFENDSGVIMRFDPLNTYCCESPFVCKASEERSWRPMRGEWDEYKTVKEILPDLDELKSCVINYLSGKQGLCDEVVDEILAVDRNGFWIEDSDGRRTRGFDTAAHLSMWALQYPLHIEKTEGVYIASHYGNKYAEKHEKKYRDEDED